MGCDLAMLKRICAQDPEALDMLDQVMQRPWGGNRRSADFKSDNVRLEQEQHYGNSASAALRRLRKERPDLHARVLAGEMSPRWRCLEHLIPTCAWA
jgi:hypothetical protein